MQISKQVISPTKLSFTVSADAEQITKTKDHVLRDLRKSVKIQGFRTGKAPLALVEKQVDPSVLQTQFLDHILNDLWAVLVRQEMIRPVSQPKVDIAKFVPYTTVEATYEVTTIGEITLPDYKKFRLAKPEVTVSAQDVNAVIENLRNRAAEKKQVERAAKTGDEVTIDFTGNDANTGDAINGADGKNYPLVLGSKSFIPGFEVELIGVKPGEDKTFTITFPKDYGATELQNRKVTFTATVQKVDELVLPKLDDAFAATVGPFKTIAELKNDIKKQLTADTQEQARRDYESAVLEALANKTTVAIPKEMVDTEIERTEADERQNLAYRGQTWQEHLEAEGVTEEAHHERQRPGAELRIKGGLILSEVAERENITVTQQELDAHIENLKSRYQDDKMRSQLDKPDNRRELASRILSDKTIKRLTDYAAEKP